MVCRVDGPRRRFDFSPISPLRYLPPGDRLSERLLDPRSTCARFLMVTAHLQIASVGAVDLVAASVILPLNNWLSVKRCVKRERCSMSSPVAGEQGSDP